MSHASTTQAAPRAVPVLTGGWNGRGTRGIVPYGSFEPRDLREAVAIINGSSEHYRFDDAGALQLLKPFTSFFDSDQYDGLFGRSTNLTGEGLRALEAVTAILANTALRRGPDPELHERLQLTVHPENEAPRGSLVQAMLDDFGDDDLTDDEVPAELLRLLPQPTLKERMEEMEAGLAALRAGEKMEINYYRDMASGPRLLMHLLDKTKALHTENVRDAMMRMHNEYPDAVNFYLAAPESEFLLETGGPAQRITDIPAFINSYWMELAGQIELRADPALLRECRTILSTQPLQQPTASPQRF